jgi:hypothetical protein
MTALGHDVMLVAPIDGAVEALGADVDSAISAVVRAKFFYPIRRSLLLTIVRLARSFWVPWHVSARDPDTETFGRLYESIRIFKPDFIWLDGPWLGVVGERLSDKLELPWLYRSHNIESIYMRGQAKLAVRLRDRLALHLACIGLKRFETRAILRSVAVFDISVDDLQYWKGLGMRHVYWLPPLPELAFRDRPDTLIVSDLVFIGNLGTPNNVRGVEWLVTEVLPRVRTQLPNVICRIVGSNPTPFICQLLNVSSGVELCSNVPDTTPYLFGAKVLVNPVMSGSGVQVKMLDMLMTDAPIVTASQGVRGLPSEFNRLFRIADNADAFAQAVCEELLCSSVNIANRVDARKVFSVAAVGKALDTAVQKRNADVNV